MAKRKYDVLVVGSGSGAAIVERALGEGLSAALIDAGPAGGTCLNNGCIPSKMLIAAADRVMDIRESPRFGIAAEVERVDFGWLMADVRSRIARERDAIRDALSRTPRLGYYPVRGEFVDEVTFNVGGASIRAETIFLASGARPSIPAVPGLEDVGYLTNETLLALEEAPRSLIVIGGGYIAVEYGHFFAAMGTAVTIVQRQERLVPQEEPEVSQLLEEELAGRMRILTGAEVVGAGKSPAGRFVDARRLDRDDTERIEAERILVASGRQSNADLLHVERAGLATDVHGFIEVDPYLQTSKEHIWAIGDANGKAMFKHAANAQAAAVWHNAMHEKTNPMNHGNVPHAVFSRPQIASIGLTEAKARESRDVFVGTARYEETAKGQALREKKGFAKAIVDRETLKILGFHIIGPDAPVLIQEISNAMANDAAVDSIFAGQHVHPAMAELVPWALSALE